MIRKSHTLLDFNMTKCPVDRIDQMANTFTSRRKTRRWPMTVFYNILDIAGINAYITWLLRNPTWHQHEQVHRRSIFLKELACALMEPWIRQRPEDQPRGAMRSTVRQDNCFWKRQKRQYLNKLPMRDASAIYARTDEELKQHAPSVTDIHAWPMETSSVMNAWTEILLFLFILFIFSVIKYFDDYLFFFLERIQEQ